MFSETEDAIEWEIAFSSPLRIGREHAQFPFIELVLAEKFSVNSTHRVQLSITKTFTLVVS